MSKTVKIVKNNQNCQKNVTFITKIPKLSKWPTNVIIVKHCQKLQQHKIKFSKVSKSVNIVKNIVKIKKKIVNKLKVVKIVKNNC